MALKITASWSQPLELHDGSRNNLIYIVDNTDNIAEKPGIYIFARKHGNNISPIYIGQADKLKSRIEQQLKFVPLMMGIKNAPAGKRILIYCLASIGKGQNKKKVLALIENSLIDHALSEGHELLNKQGTKRPTHTIQFHGNRLSEKIAPRKMLIKSALTRRSN